MSLLSNQTCLNEGLLPNIAYFILHDPAAHDDTETRKYWCVPLMMVYKGSENARDNFSKFIERLQP